VSDITVEVPIYPSSFGKISVGTAGKETSAVSFSSDDAGSVVTVGLNPEGENCGDPTQVVRVSIIETGQIPDCFGKGCCYPGDDERFWWEREVDHVDAFTDEPVLERLPTIHIINPNCNKWEESYVKLYGPSRCGSPSDFTHGCSYLQYDAGYDGIGELEGHYSTQVPQNNIVPGMQLKLWNRFQGGDIRQAGETYWCTCCFTGGTVVVVNGEYGDPAVSYVVNIEGKNVPAKSYGFEEYHVGDWVFLSKPGGECSDVGRTDACKNGCEDSDEGDSDEGDSDDSGGYILSMVNSLRAGLGLSPLSMNEKLKHPK